MTGNPLNGVISGFQQALCLAQPGTIEPLQGSHASLLVEASAQGTGTHHCLGCDVFQSKFPVQVLCHPPQYRLKRSLVQGRQLMHNELCLPAIAHERHHCDLGGVSCYSRTIISTNDVET